LLPRPIISLVVVKIISVPTVGPPSHQTIFFANIVAITFRLKMQPQMPTTLLLNNQRSQHGNKLHPDQRRHDHLVNQ